MNSLLFDDISTCVENLYNNLFLVALDRNYNLRAIVQDVSEHIDEYYENTDVVVPRGFEGVLFVMAVAKSMRASLTDILYMSNVEKKLIVYDLIKKINVDEIFSDDNNYYSDENIIKFRCLYTFQDNDCRKVQYEILFTGIVVSEEKNNYSVEIKFADDGSESYDNDLIYNCAILWNEEIGDVAEFIDKIDQIILSKEIETLNADIIELGELSQEMHDFMYDLRRKWFGYLMEEGIENLTFKELKTKGISEFTYSFVIDGNRYDKEGFKKLELDALVTKVELIENDKTLLVDTDKEEATVTEKNDDKIIVGHKKAEVIDEKTGKRIIDELVTYISNDTRTVSLLDEFEGYDEGEPVYRRLVIKNNKYAWVLKLKNNAGINLVIERSRNRDYVGDITFTEFKQDNDRDLREFIKSEITDEIVDKYLDKDQFYRFSKPYRLRAQNRKNRTGYGWEWDWSGGYGDYIEGTLYGETTDYVFVGAYISSMYNSYDPEDRKPFVEHTFNSSLKQENINIVSYSGKLSRYTTDKKFVQRFIKVVATNGKYKYLPTSYDEQEQTAYLIDSAYNKYCEQLKGKIALVKTIFD